MPCSLGRRIHEPEYELLQAESEKAGVFSTVHNSSSCRCFTLRYHPNDLPISRKVEKSIPLIACIFQGFGHYFSIRLRNFNNTNSVNNYTRTFNSPLNLLSILVL